MQHSTRRILTTHAGSLPRPGRSARHARRQGAGQAGRRGRARGAAAAARSRRSCKSRSSSASTSSTTANTPSRASSPTSTSGSAASRSTSERRGAARGPARARRCRSPSSTRRATSARAQNRMVCTGPVTYKGQRAAAARHREPQGGARRRQPVEAFMPAISPVERRGLAAQRLLQDRRRNTSSPSPRRCARNTRRSSMPGFLLQIDDPRLVSLLPGRARRQHRASAANGPNAARRGAQPRAARHPAGEGPPPHLLRHQHGAARARHGGQAPASTSS